MLPFTRRRLLAGGGALAFANPEFLAAQQPTAARVDAVLDTDTYNEIDDQFAVAYAMRSPDRMNIEAIYAAPYLNDRSTSAGDGMRKSYDEILRILNRLKVPHKDLAHRGSENFMAGAGKPVESPAARNLIERARRKRSGPLYVLTIGAPTNVSSAILMEPKIKDQIVVVWLGGQPFDWPTASEFNLKQDIHASRVLYDSGVPLVNIPTKNVSEHLRTTVPEMQKFLKGKSPIADYLCTEFEKYAQEHSPSPLFAYSKVIWDISAVAWMVEPKWVPVKEAPSPILTDDLKYKQGTRRHMVRVAYDCNRDRIFNDLFTKLNR
ncbi:MAG TPA: nucleoside hydrolase [Bryobacteraceae bacterium]|jgi:inosine-uridine nucleoside N-ribohydrolase|nr:nucleoside hydrolase [Bryobacteraceae bacterium]